MTCTPLDASATWTARWVIADVPVLAVFHAVRNLVAVTVLNSGGGAETKAGSLSAHVSDSHDREYRHGGARVQSCAKRGASGCASRYQHPFATAAIPLPRGQCESCAGHPGGLSTHRPLDYGVAGATLQTTSGPHQTRRWQILRRGES